jgi:hypothetical protein
LIRANIQAEQDEITQNQRGANTANNIQDPELRFAHDLLNRSLSGWPGVVKESPEFG